MTDAVGCRSAFLALYQPDFVFKFLLRFDAHLELLLNEFKQLLVLLPVKQEEQSLVEHQVLEEQVEAELCRQRAILCLQECLEEVVLQLLLLVLLLVNDGVQLELLLASQRLNIRRHSHVEVLRLHQKYVRVEQEHF